MSTAPIEPLSWQGLEALASPEPDRVTGPTNAQATLRLFGQGESDLRVTLFRDHHAWCPYCQKVWLWLEEKRIPYRIRKVTMVCYGEKEPWFKRLVPSGMLPALDLDGRLITESDDILLALESAFGPLGAAMEDPRVLPLRQLERTLFRAWCQWLCVPRRSEREEAAAERAFDRVAAMVDQALQATPGPFFLAEFSTADLVFTPYIERMNASLYYYKGYGLKERHPSIAAWFTAMEGRSTYLGTQGDFHTHAHDLPPQMGGCFASGSPRQLACRQRVDQGPWPLEEPLDPETSQPAVAGAAAEALRRVLRHRDAIQAVNPVPPERFGLALRCALTRLIEGWPCQPPPGSALGLLYLRDRISVPRDMSLQAARALRQALTQTAADQATGSQAMEVQAMGRQAGGEPIPLPNHHRRDQDPRPFQRAVGSSSPQTNPP
ncbi:MULTISPECIES: glutathione S-transferase family protein [unclassified Synechococcus]|uniref:glutathione S-transferase family protein n=1 Tax=unclassified Synechococcus TaxID=2626047 RepID=UPI0020CBD2BB|nr:MULTISPECIES: glutathione S-transferase family protein [unclassified Synechococcus]